MKSIFIVFVFSLFAFTACHKSEQVTPPEVVKSALTAQFSTAKSVDWSLEAEGRYEAEFQVDGKEMSVLFDAAGNWLETETEIAVSDLPEAVRQAIAAQFSGYQSTEAESAETPEGLNYEVELKKGDEEMEVVFQADGTVLKKEMETEDEESEAQER